MATDPKSLFCQALERPPGPERDAYLDAECGENASLRAEVEALLLAHDNASGFLATAARDERGTATGPARPRVPAPHAEGPGTLIGPYRLLQQIGEGGMGTVYMAEQKQPVRRKVALKIIKPGMDSAQVVARFEAERQALALMDHPNIAKVLDAGTTDSGRPFFVMELVNGIPITDYCDQARLTTDERLKLFVGVCQAIQHAHQKGVIHRDIKPSNVLVTLVDGKPIPKVIDFGVAKAIGQQLTERSLFTHFGSIVGTLEYMSPEQAALSGVDVDTRSDVYALGVILYELLTGSTPLERSKLREAAYTEILRRIKEEEPPKPSARLSSSGDRLGSIASTRSTDAKHLSRAVRGDLDWVVMKSLEKDRSRRYETANGFARDVERYLSGDPVEAGPPSALYRFKKLAKKHRVALNTAAAFALLLILATTVSIALMLRALAAERVAANRLDVINRANVSLTNARASIQARFDLAMEAIKTFHTGVSEDVLLSNDNLKPVRDRLLGDAAKFYKRLGGQLKSGTDQASRRALGQAYSEMALLASKIGATDEAIAAHRQALEVRRRLAAEPNADDETKADVGRSLNDLGFVLSGTSHKHEAQASYEEAQRLLESLRRGSPALTSVRHELARSLHYRGMLLSETGKPAEAIDAYRAALAIRQGLADSDRGNTQFQYDLAAGHLDIGNLQRETGKTAEALASIEEARSIVQGLVDANPSAIKYQRVLAASHLNMGFVLHRTGKTREALVSYELARIIFQRLADANPAVTQVNEDLALIHHNIGVLLCQTGNMGEGMASVDIARTIRQRLADANPAVIRFQRDLAQSHDNIGIFLQETGKPTEALASLRAGLLISQRLADANPNVTNFQGMLAGSHNQIGKILRETGKPAEALESFKVCLAVRRRLADSNPAVTDFQYGMAVAHVEVGLLLFTTGKPEEGLANLQSARVIFQKLVDANPTVIDFQTSLAESHRFIGVMLNAEGRSEEALASMKAALAIQRPMADDNPNVSMYQTFLSSTYNSIGIFLKEHGNLEEALVSMNASEAIERRLADANPNVPRYQIDLASDLMETADILRLIGRPAQALPVFEASLAIIDRLSKAQPAMAAHLETYLVSALKGIGATQQSAGRIADAAASWRRAVAADEKLRTADLFTLASLAGCHARLGGIAGTPGSGLTAADGAAELDTAMAVLRRAVAAGYRQVDAMKRDPDLDPLRGRADFQSLMMDLAFPSNPFAPEGAARR